jgi:SprT-like family
MEHKMNNKHTTREGWLVAGMALLDKEFFSGMGYTLPEKVQCSCGWPLRSSKAIGQCHPPTVSKDGTTHLFLCPTQDEPLRVLDILLHEMIHAQVGCEHGHKKPFKKRMKEVGLVGKATATECAEGSELWLKLSSIATELGPYPHAAVSKKGGTIGKKGTTWTRLQSPEDESYRITISPKNLEEHGPPQDPWGNEMVPAEDDES